MTTREIHVGDVGTVFEFIMYDGSEILPIGGASALTIKLVPPGGATREKTAVLTTDGSDGKLRYVSIANDLDVAGTWKAQPYVVLPSGPRHGSEYEFIVWPVN